VYWLSFSVYARYVPADSVLELFHAVCDIGPSPADWKNSTAHQDLWDSEYKSMSDWFVEQFAEYAEKFLKSAAGAKYEASIDEHR
jgi:hypothetical protein